MIDHEALLEAIAALPDKQRTAAEMRYYMEESEDEIARQMGVTTRNVRSLLSKSRKKLERIVPISPPQSDYISEGEDESQRPSEPIKRGRTVCVPVFPVSLNPPADYLYGSELWWPFWSELLAIHTRVLRGVFPKPTAPPRRETLRPAVSGNRKQRRAAMKGRAAA